MRKPVSVIHYVVRIVSEPNTTIAYACRPNKSLKQFPEVANDATMCPRCRKLVDGAVNDFFKYDLINLLNLQRKKNGNI